ncbi:MAG: fasciclin domain-containing protein [Caulobacteraceae bacterium]
MKPCSLPFTAVAASLLAFGASAQMSAPKAAATMPAAALVSSPRVTPNGNIVSTLQGAGNFTILLKALTATGLSDTLKTAPGLTLFAPTDAAFEMLPPTQLAALMAPMNAPVLQKVLTYHLVNLNLDSNKMKGAKGPVSSVEASKLQLDGSGPVLKVNDANIIQADVRATNGLIHVIDKVLAPPDVTLPTASASLGTAEPAPGG